MYKLLPFIWLVYFLLEQQHMRTSFLWTEVGVSDLAAPPVDHGATLQDPGGLSFISLTDTGERVRVTNAHHFPLCFSRWRNCWLLRSSSWMTWAHFSFFLVYYVYLMHLQVVSKRQKDYVTITVVLHKWCWVVLFFYVPPLHIKVFRSYR